jgi:hypothetical protein
MAASASRRETSRPVQQAHQRKRRRFPAICILLLVLIGAGVAAARRPKEDLEPDPALQEAPPTAAEGTAPVDSSASVCAPAFVNDKDVPKSCQLFHRVCMHQVGWTAGCSARRAARPCWSPELCLRPGRGAPVYGLPCTSMSKLHTMQETMVTHDWRYAFANPQREPLPAAPQTGEWNFPCACPSAPNSLQCIACRQTPFHSQPTSYALAPPSPAPAPQPRAWTPTAMR